MKLKELISLLELSPWLLTSNKTVSFLIVWAIGWLVGLLVFVGNRAVHRGGLQPLAEYAELSRNAKRCERIFPVPYYRMRSHATTVGARRGFGSSVQRSS